MFIKKRNFLFLILMILPYALYAWGDGDKLSDGSCRFEKETGYIDSSLYVKENEAFLIVDGGDSRYGTMSTVYNALTCEKVTSGEKIESNFSGIMEKKGFVSINSDSKEVLDKSFQYKTKFFKNSNEVIVHVEFIPNHVIQELKTLLSLVSNKRASSQITISDSARELLHYSSFYNLLFEKINSLPISEINYVYTLSLIDKLKLEKVAVNRAKVSLLAKQEELKQEIARKKEELRQKLAKLEEEANDKMFKTEVKSIKDVPQWMSKMTQLGKQDKISKYIPKIMRLRDFGNNLTPNNFFSSIEYKYILKDLKLNGVRAIYDDDKYYGIELEYPKYYDISLKEKPTCSPTGETSTSEFGCGFFWMNTCVGTYKHYKCKANTSQIAYIEQKLLGTTKVATVLNKGWNYKYMISRYTKSSSSSSSDSSSYCFASGVSEGAKNVCLATVKRDSSYCFASGVSEGAKNVCLAIVKRDSSYCFGSGISEGAKNVCLAQTK